MGQKSEFDDDAREKQKNEMKNLLWQLGRRPGNRIIDEFDSGMYSCLEGAS